MKTAEFFRSGKVRRAVIVLACIALACGGFRLWEWAWPKIHYASLDRQDWREDMEPWEYFPPVPADAERPPESMWISHYLTLYDNWDGPELLSEMIDRGELLYMPGFEPGRIVSYSGGKPHTCTLTWRKEDGAVIALKASPVSGGSRYEPGGGQFIPTEPLEIARRPLITCRDGVDIVCAGGEDEEKVMRFYKDETWYQICGEEEISYEEMARVLDYYFNDPLSFF